MQESEIQSSASASSDSASLGSSESASEGASESASEEASESASEEASNGSCGECEFIAVDYGDGLDWEIMNDECDVDDQGVAICSCPFPQSQPSFEGQTAITNCA